MTIYTDTVQRPRSLAEVETSWGDLAGAAFDSAFDTNPLMSLLRLDELAEAEEGEAGLAARGPGGVIIGLPEREAPDSPMLSRDDALRRAAEAKVDLDVPDEGIRERALDIMINRHIEEKERQFLISNYEGSKMPTVLASGLAASVTDPINIASAFIPVVAPSRYADMLAKATGAGGRAAVRAKVGLAEGVLGSLVVEPLPLLAAKQDQTDYTMADSLLNVAFGGVLGGGFHTVGGAISDRIANSVRLDAAEKIDPVEFDPKLEVETKASLDDVDVQWKDRLSGEVQVSRRADVADIAERFDEVATEGWDESGALRMQAKAENGQVVDLTVRAPTTKETLPEIEMPAIDRVAEASFRTKKDALKAAVAQSVTGREVDVEPVFRGEIPKPPQLRAVSKLDAETPDIRAEVARLEVDAPKTPEVEEALKLSEDAEGYGRALQAAAVCLNRT